jgi:hypothetical protein
MYILSYSNKWNNIFLLRVYFKSYFIIKNRIYINMVILSSHMIFLTISIVWQFQNILLYNFNA